MPPFVRPTDNFWQSNESRTSELPSLAQTRQRLGWNCQGLDSSEEGRLAGHRSPPLPRIQAEGFGSSVCGPRRNVSLRNSRQRISTSQYQRRVLGSKRDAVADRVLHWLLSTRRRNIIQIALRIGGFGIQIQGWRQLLALHGHDRGRDSSRPACSLWMSNL